MRRPRPVMLIVLDGWGLAPDGPANAISLANLPNYRRLLATYPHGRLRADGETVGLLRGQMGNSNVGHLTLGAGRVLDQDIVRIHKSIEDGSLHENPTLHQFFAGVEPATTVHLMGLVSTGGVHSHRDHLAAMVEECRSRLPDTPIAVHCILDGRDVPPKAAGEDLQWLEGVLHRSGQAAIATVSGRFFTMDRDHRWDRVEKAWRAMVLGEGVEAGSAAEGLTAAYARGETDEFVTPTVVVRDGRPVATIGEGESVFFFNFRADRAREICHALVDRDFTGFDRHGRRARVFGMMPYEVGLDVPALFARHDAAATVGEVVSWAGLNQLRLAETEKYAHVTYFFSGGREREFAGEERILVPSPKVATYDHWPEMSATEVAREAAQAIRGGKYALIVMNFANADMVGHTGVIPATVAGVEAVDRGLGKIERALAEVGGAALVVADHGNAEVMVDPETGEPHTAHTTDMVPAILVDPARPGDEPLRPGTLADVAPTLLSLLGLDAPDVMTGRSILQREAY